MNLIRKLTVLTRRHMFVTMDEHMDSQIDKKHVYRRKKTDRQTVINIKNNFIDSECHTELIRIMLGYNNVAFCCLGKMKNYRKSFVQYF